MDWPIEYSDEFEGWFDGLDENSKAKVVAGLRILRDRGPMLGRPQADTIKGSRHVNMKELIVQHKGDPLRIFFAFDPRRTAYMMIGGCKAGNNRFYEKTILLADRIYDRHLARLGKIKKEK